jgi:transcriptional regulator with XRE-family HTH domain
VSQPLKPNVIVGRNICRLRTAAGITQEKLAEKADVDIRSLQRIEAGTWNMTVNYLDRFRRALRCDWSDLLRGI